ncbi:MAG: haloacid dehalogenase [Actinobacteria bacterium]|nr:haloacid dehalogenase [Actinomycetota bacterium]
MSYPDLSGVSAAVREVLDDKYRARETGLSNSRAIIRNSANAIRAIHRGEMDRAAELMEEAGRLLAEANEALAGHPDILYAGFVGDASKEYAEARLTHALALGAPLPLPADLGVRAAPYLNGLGEAVGEMRRRMLDLLRRGDLVAAEETFGAMDTIHELLADLDYPDGMTGGLRRTTDVARALIERSRSDLTATVIQERLRRDLAGS